MMRLIPLLMLLAAAPAAAQMDPDFEWAPYVPGPADGHTVVKFWESLSGHKVKRLVAEAMVAATSDVLIPILDEQMATLARQGAYEAGRPAAETITSAEQLYAMITGRNSFFSQEIYIHGGDLVNDTLTGVFSAMTPAGRLDPSVKPLIGLIRVFIERDLTLTLGGKLTRIASFTDTAAATPGVRKLLLEKVLRESYMDFIYNALQVVPTYALAQAFGLHSAPAPDYVPDGDITSRCKALVEPVSTTANSSPYRSAP